MLYIARRRSARVRLSPASPAADPVPPAAPSPAPRRPPRWRRRLRLVVANLALLAVADLALGLLLAHHLFHAYPREAGYLQRSETLGFRPIPGSEILHRDAELPGGEVALRRNAQGLRRDQDVALAKAPGTPRIVVVGDSHTDGMTGNADTYPGQLEAALRQRGGPVEVLNAGVGRYSPWQSYLLLEEELVRFAPDAVVVALYVGNDLLDLLRPDDRPHLVLEGDRVVARGPEFIVFRDGPLQLWRKRSLLYRFYREQAEFTLERALLTVDLVRSLGGDWGDVWAFLRGLQRCDRALVSQSLAQVAYFVRFPAAEARAFQLMRHVVERHRALAASRGYALRFLLIPSRVQVEGAFQLERLTRGYALFGLGPEHLADDDRLHGRLQALLQELGQRVVDPLAALRADAAPDRPLYWNLDDHVNLRGCAAIARALADELAPLVQEHRR